MTGPFSVVTGNAMRQQFSKPMDVEAWIAQTWAYDRHNVGDTKIDGKSAFGGDPIRALHTIKAKALLMSGELDLYNPQENGIEAAAAIPDGRHVTIPSVQGHVAAASGFKPAGLEFINATVHGFLADVTNSWRKTQ